MFASLKIILYIILALTKNHEIYENQLLTQIETDEKGDKGVVLKLKGC